MTTTAADLTAARDRLSAATEKRSKIEARQRDLTHSIDPLTRGIAQAIAAGDDEAATGLRQKREAAQAELPDLSRAIQIAQAEVDAADRDLARLEIDGMAADFEEKVRRFVGYVAEANRLSSAILVTQQVYQMRFSRAGYENPMSDPRHAKQIMARLLSPLGRRMFNELRDYKTD